jgi:uncharacterized protein with GYD domain
MAKYMFSASYSAEGVRGLLKEGGSARRDVLAKGLEALGGRLEVFYYTFGKHDVVGIGEIPDNTTAAALSLTIAASGAVSIHTTVLLTPEEIDAATKMAVSYRPPGA